VCAQVEFGVVCGEGEGLAEVVDACVLSSGVLDGDRGEDMTQAVEEGGHTDGAAPDEGKDAVCAEVGKEIDVLKGADACPVGGAFPERTVEFFVLVVR